MDKVGNLLNQAVNRAGIADEVLAGEACQGWEEAVTDLFNLEASKCSKAITFRNRVLTIAVASSGWAQEFQLQSHVLLERVNQKLDASEQVRRIMFRVQGEESFGDN